MSLCKNIRLDGCRFPNPTKHFEVVETRREIDRNVIDGERSWGDGCSHAIHLGKLSEHSHVRRALFAENLDANLTLLNPHSHMRLLRLYGCRNLRGRVPLNHFLNLVVTLENFHEEEDNKIEKIAGIRLPGVKAKNDGVVVYRRDDETVTEEQRKIAREVEAEHACARLTSRDSFLAAR